MVSNVLADLQSSGASPFSHQDRLIKLRFSEGSRIAEDTLLPHQVSGEESLSRCYRYTLDCLSADVHIELKDLQGQPIEIALLLPAGGERLLTGLVTRSEALGADGGFARYRLTIEPALATLTYRRNSRVFQDKSVIEIVQTILDEHLAVNPVFVASFKHESHLTRSYPARSYCLQYRESDLAFIERLLAEEGISYRFTHMPDAEHSIRNRDGSQATSGEAQGTPLHTLILFDADYRHPQSSLETVRFHRTDGVETADAIDNWEGSRQLQSSQSSLTSFDYKAVSPYPAADAQRIDPGKRGGELAATLEDYDPQTLYYASDPVEAERYAALRQQAKDLASKAFRGEGSVRGLEVGNWFEFQDHPVHDQDNPEDRQFLVTGLSFEARNNLLPEEEAAVGGLLGAPADSRQNQPPYRNTFSAVRRHVPVVPDYHLSRHQKPTAPGATTATVVGPQDEEIFTDEHGRIKVQFHWQRPQDHPEGGADLDDRSSTWLRVAYPSAGAQWGTQYIPRIGQEVLIDFLEADIDRPIVTGVVYNGSHRPPSFSGVGQLPANKTLSGVKSKEYKGSRYNELLFDDSTDEIRAKLSSEHAKTQLNQGFLIHPRSNGKGEPRGEGFELRTDAAGAIRAAKGLLISTDGRLNASGKQLAREELVDCLQAARELAQTLADLAEKQQADKTDTAPQRSLSQAVDAWEKGTNTDAQGTAGATDAAGQQPIIALGSPAGIVLSTPQSMTQYTGKNLDLVAQQDLNQSTGKRWIVNVAESVSLFTAGVADKLKQSGKEIAFKLIAAKGKILIQAQDGVLAQEAEQDITLKSNARIRLNSRSDTTIVESGGASIQLSGGNVTIKCPGSFVVHAAKHSFVGPASDSPELPNMPKSKFANGQGWSISG